MTEEKGSRMKRAMLLLAVGLALVAFNTWLFRGAHDPVAAAQEAYQQGDYARAVEEYQKAAPEAGDLGSLAHNQAAALYRLQRFSEADARYQFAEERSNEFRAAKAEYDRGNCALREAVRAGASPKTALLDKAAGHFRCCLQHQRNVEGADKLFSDARHNLEVTKIFQNSVLQGDQVAGDDQRPGAGDSQDVASKDTKQKSSSHSKPGCPDCEPPAATPENQDQAQDVAQAQTDDDDPDEECPD
jgi:tetratricopeptide (TPR) repeat protein